MTDEARMADDGPSDESVLAGLARIIRRSVGEDQLLIGGIGLPNDTSLCAVESLTEDVGERAQPVVEVHIYGGALAVHAEMYPRDAERLAKLLMKHAGLARQHAAEPEGLPEHEL